MRKLLTACFVSLGCLFGPTLVLAVDVVDLAQAPEVLQRVSGQILDDENPALAHAFGLGPNEGIAIIRTRVASGNRVITRYRQTYSGVPVWGKQLIIERDGNGAIRALNGRLVKGMKADVGRVDPALDRDAVVGLLRQDVIDSFDAGTAVIEREKSELVIHIDSSGKAHLAYAVEFLADSDSGGRATRPVFIVDANSGEVLFSYDALTYQDPVCNGDSCLLLDQPGQSGTGASRVRGKVTPASFDIHKFTTLTAPDGSTMTVSISGGTGDADLYVRKDFAPTTSSYDCRPYKNGNNESCVFTVGAGETWYAGLYAYTDFSGVDLLATSKASVTVEHIGNGPGGNDKTGVYYYGGAGEYGALDLTIENNLCTMLNTNVKTVDLDNGTSGNTAYSYAYSGECFNDADAVNGAFSPLNDAHYFGGVVYDMYNAYLEVAPLDFQLSMRVHYSTNYENAFWDGSSMTFGDGASTFYPLVSLDVSAHEVSHGFTEQNSNLIYSSQSGGMNESFSDIAGETAEHFMAQQLDPPETADFLVGADIFKGSGALRYMCDPTLDGRSIDNANDFTGNLDVHYSSGVFNKAFCLLSEERGWGVQKAFEVFAWANMNCWVPDSTFQDGAQCVLNESLAAGYEGTDVIAAFDGVGITLVLAEPPGTPSLSESAHSHDQVDLAWDDVVNESGYEMQRSDTGELGSYVAIAQLGAGSTSYTDSGLTPETTYYYQVVAVNAYGSAGSNSLSVTTDPAPETPPLTLEVSTYKVKGVNTADLAWSSTGEVGLFIDDQDPVTISDNPYTDSTGEKGGMTRAYQVCTGAQMSVCSDVITVTW